MFLRHCTRKKDGKEHRYWSLVENRRLSDGRVVQRHVLYLGEINSSQEAAWRRSVEVLCEKDPVPQTLSLFAEKRLWKRLAGPSRMDLNHEQLLMKLGATQNQSPNPPSRAKIHCPSSAPRFT